MKRFSTVKRLLALLCALAMTSGAALHGNAVTVFAGEDVPPAVTSDAPSGETEAPTIDLIQVLSTATESLPPGAAEAFTELFMTLAQFQTEQELLVYLAHAANREHILQLIGQLGVPEDQLEQIRQGFIALVEEAFGEKESDADIAVKKIEEDLKFYHPLIQKTGTPILMVNMGEWHTLGNRSMQKVAKKVADGYNVALFSRYEHKDRVVLIPAGSTVDLSRQWYGPLCLSELYEDITEEYKAQDKSLSRFLKLKNIIDARAAAAAE